MNDETLFKPIAQALDAIYREHEADTNPIDFVTTVICVAAYMVGNGSRYRTQENVEGLIKVYSDLLLKESTRVYKESQVEVQKGKH